MKLRVKFRWEQSFIKELDPRFLFQIISVVTGLPDWKFDKKSRNIEIYIIILHALALVFQMIITLFHIKEWISNFLILRTLCYSMRSFHSLQFHVSYPTSTSAIKYFRREASKNTVRIFSERALKLEINFKRKSWFNIFSVEDGFMTKMLALLYNC